MSELYYPEEDEHQIPLGVKFETKPIWAPVKDLFDVGATGAAIVMAAYDAHMAGRPVSYSRNKLRYGPHSHPLLKYKAVTGAVDQLARDGWLQHYKQAVGYHGWQSAFEATPELIEAIQGILDQSPRLKIALPAAPIILRDEAGKPQAFKETRALTRQARKVDALNECIRSAVITEAGASNVHTLAAPMVRIYNKTFDRGGRFYAMGSSWQNVTRAQRKAVTINGESVVELDYCTMHPAILYAEAGITAPRDCYDITGYPRDLAKLAMFMLINAKTLPAARLAIAHSDGRKICKDTKQRVEDPEDKQFMQVLAEPGSQEAIRLASILINRLKAAHKPIVHAFHSDAGARLMKIDATIAEMVMVRMMDQGHVVLPVHDSFLVQASQQEALETAMMEAAHRCGYALNVSAK